jgi:nicotinamidase-related amidase
MTSTTFINRFNNGTIRDRAQLFIDLDLKEADQHMEMKMPAQAECVSVHILAYAKVRAGVWYIKDHQGERLPVAAFPLYPEGERTFDEWYKTVPGTWGSELKEKIIQAFDKIVMPEYADN